MPPNRNKICGILDFSGSHYNGVFLVREVAMIGLGRSVRTAKTEVFDYKPYMCLFKEIAEPTNKKRRTSPRPPHQDVYDINSLPERIMNFYEAVKTNENYVVGFKGGHVEKDVLEELQIPYLNLEDLGCPRFDDMDTKDLNRLACRYHRRLNLHCPAVEVTAFRRWYRQYCG